VTGFGLTLAAVLGASVLGSLHCVGMCGGFVASVAGACDADGRRKLGPLLAYQAARGSAYVSLGALAGLLGAGLDASAAMVGIQRVAGPLMGIVLIAMAVSAWRGSTGSRGSRGSSQALITPGLRPRRAPLDRLRLRLTLAVRERGAKAGAAAGLLTALLPCGWLWAYIAVAASTGSVTRGLAVMAAFWLGSVPALLGVGLLAGAFGRRLGRHAPRITAILLLALGLLSLSGKLGALLITPTHTEPPTDRQTEQHEPAIPREAPCH